MWVSINSMVLWKGFSVRSVESVEADIQQSNKPSSVNNLGNDGNHMTKFSAQWLVASFVFPLVATRQRLELLSHTDLIIFRVSEDQPRTYADTKSCGSPATIRIFRLLSFDEQCKDRTSDLSYLVSTRQSLTIGFKSNSRTLWTRWRHWF
jgi:hypothetical protein